MSEPIHFGRKLLLSVAAIVAMALPMIAGFTHTTPVRAQAAAEAPKQDIADTWQGTLHAGRDLRIVFKISREDGSYKAVMYSIDQGGDGIPVSKITLDGTTVKMTISAIGGSFEGKLSADGKTITGNWTQGQNLPLELTRATPETEWTIPPPRPKIPPLAANADPSFEVATIKPSKPDDQRKAFIVTPDMHFQIINQPLSSILSFAYGIQVKQLVGLPAWADEDKYDIDAKPDAEGAPSNKQWRSMLQKLIVERFQFKFHRDKKEMSVYVLSVAKSGSKLTKSEGDPNGLPGLGFSALGDLHVRNANMGDFCDLMQNAVLDRPVIDQSGVTGRFNFELKWTPDDSQFAGMGAKVPPPTDAADAPPNLYTAIQEQIGLKLDATKAPADVLIIEHVEKPSAN